MRAGSARRAAAGIVALATVLTLPACSPAGGMTEDSSGEPFVVARTAGVRVLDPARADEPSTVHTLDLVYDTLLTVNDEGELAPGLATNWKVSEDGTTVTFRLRKGVTFHDGAAFTAADAMATLERIRDGDAGSPLRSHLRNVDSIEAPDPFTLVLELKQPDTALLTALTRVSASVLDAGDIRAGTVARRPNGTGPFRWVSRKPGSGEKGRVTLAANAAYWDGAPKLSEVVLRVVPEEGAIRSGVAAGEYQLGVVSDAGVVRNVDRDAARVLEQPTLSPYVVMLNRNHGPLRALKVRQAIACAVNRQQVVEIAYFGHGAITGPITSPAYSYHPTAGLPCDPPDRRKAEKLLAAAGYPNGFILETTVAGGGDAAGTRFDPNVAAKVARSLQAQLSSIGIRLELGRRPVGAAGGNGSAASFDAAVTRVGGSYDPYLMYARYFAGDAGTAALGRPSRERLAALLHRANTSTDASRRGRIFAALQREMLRLSPWVWLFRGSVYYLVGEDVRGFEPTPRGSLTHLRSARLIDSDSE